MNNLTMEGTLIFLYVVFFLSIVIHITSALIVSAFVLPLQAKEAGVKNGLQQLRKQMLMKGILSLVVIIASILALTLRFFVEEPTIQRVLIVSIVFIHAAVTFGKALIDYRVYHQQYTPMNKKRHEIIEKLENGEVKVVPIEEKLQADAKRKHQRLNDTVKDIK